MSVQTNSPAALAAHSMSSADVITQLQSHPDAYGIYCSLPPAYRQEFLDFCSGKTSLYLCYDAFFHFVFDTNAHPDRVEKMLGAILGQKIRIIEVLPREGSQMAELGSEIIVDLLVRLEDQSLVNLEIQKYGYYFPAKRMDCYCADLIMREYNRLRNLYKKKFTYRDLHPVIAIVLLEKSPEEFKPLPEIYIHRGETRWDSGLDMPGLTWQIFVCLDKFNSIMQNEDITTPLEAWLTVLTTQSPARIDTLVRNFPDFAGIYRDIFLFRTRPEELIHMYSKVLAEADRNMDRMMIDDMGEEIQRLKSDLADRDQALADQKQALADSLADIEKLREEIRRLKSGQ